jgi:hypothetical protein
MISKMGERVPFLSPIKAKESKGCVEKWMLYVRGTKKILFSVSLIDER